MYLRKNHRIVGNLIGIDPDKSHQIKTHGLPIILMAEEARLLHSLNIVQIVEYPSSISDLNLNDSKLVEINKNLQTKLKEEVYERRQKEIVANLDKIVKGKMTKLKLNLEGRELETFRQNTLNSMLKEIAEKELDYQQYYIESPYNEIKLEKEFQLKPLEPFSLNLLKYLTYKHFWSKGYFLTDGMKFGGHFLAYEHDPLMFHSKFIIICCHTEEELNQFETKMTQGLGRLGKNVRKNVIVVHYKNSTTNDNNNEDIAFKHIQWNPMLFNEDKINH